MTMIQTMPRRRRDRRQPRRRADAPKTKDEHFQHSQELLHRFAISH